MNNQTHTKIFKRTGWVLVAVGVADIFLMVYCIINQMSYSSSFNIFAVIAGIFLLRGNLRAASIVRWFSVFMLSGCITLFLFWPFLQPIGLTLTQLRLNLVHSLVSFCFAFFIFALLFWLAKELGSRQIQVMRDECGRKKRNMYIPAGIGFFLVISLVIFLSFFLGGETAEKAKHVAERQVGPGYTFHVSNLNIVKNNKGTSVHGNVTAWNYSEIKNVEINWEE